MEPDIDVTHQNGSLIHGSCCLIATRAWQEFHDLQNELHTIQRADQIMVDGKFTPQWAGLVEGVLSLRSSSVPGIPDSVQALMAGMVMTVRVNLGAPGREELRRVYGF